MKRIFETLAHKWPEYILEVLVLIIGIYSAFALERWNENRNEEKFEQATLERILTNLKTDRENLLSIHHYFLKAIYSTEKLLAAKQNTPESDSIKYWLANIAQFDRFQPLTNAYEVLKSRGLDVLRNQDLAYQIGKYYDDDAQRMTKTIGDIEYSFNTDWVPLLRTEVTDFQFTKFLVLEDSKSLYENGSVRKIVILNRDNYSSGSKTIHQVLNSLNELISEVEIEIK